MAAKVVPQLTDEQRREAHQRSLELRRDRAEIKRMLRELPSPRVALRVLWDTDSATQGMKVYDLLMALPGIGTRKALALLQQAGIPSHNTVRACGPKQTERLFALLDK